MDRAEFLKNYEDKVILGYISDIIAASEGSQSEAIGNATTSSDGAEYFSFSQPQGGGQIKLPTAERQSYQKKLIQQVIASGYAGFVKADESIFTFSNGSWANSFMPDFAMHLNNFGMQLLPKLGVKKINIVSGFRDPEYNRTMKAANASGHGATYSPHMAGIAVDFSAKEKTRYTIADAAYYYGFGGIAIGEYFVHIDISAKGFWSYPGVPMYKGPGSG